MNAFSILLSLFFTLETFSTNYAYPHTRNRMKRSNPVLKHPTVLYASANVGFPRPASDHTSRFTVHPTDSVGAIPSNFVTGAYLYPTYTDKFLIKPKRWAISEIYDPTTYYDQPQIDSESELDGHSFQVMDEDIDSFDQDYDRGYDYEHASQNEPFVKEFPLPSPYQDEEQFERINQGRTFEDQENNFDNPPSFEVVNQPHMYEDSFSNQYQPYIPEEKTEPERQIYRSANPWPTARGQPSFGECHQEKDLGVGPDEVSSWYFDRNQDRCWWFGYRGKGGNSNRFSSRSACENYCIHGISDLCQSVNCKWSGTRCELVSDEECEQRARQESRSGACPPRQPVCVSRHGTRIAPELNTTLVPGECRQLKDEGSCQKKNPHIRFYYNPAENNCNHFYFHGCGGNDNRFETKAECMSHCTP